MRRTSPFDTTLFVAVIALIAVGWSFIYSASYPRAISSAETNHNSIYYAIQQIKYTAIGALMLIACWKIPLQFYRRYALWIICATVGLLLAVLVFAKVTHGNQAYFRIGTIQFQPSEFAKIAIILTLPAMLARRPELLKNLRGLFNGPAWFVIVPAGLVALEQDIGMTIAISLATTVILLIAGMKFRFVGMPILAVALLGLLVYGTLTAATHGKPWEKFKGTKMETRINRVRAWLNPWDDTIQESYQLRQSLIAIGSGGVLGRGVTEGRQKWFYLPAPHNDYIVANIAEEIGFLGIAVFIFGLYSLLIFRGFSIAHSAPDEYAALVAVGCTVMLAVSALINIAVASNAMPSMGLNLPFVSYGGSSLIASMMMAGLLLNISAIHPARDRRSGAAEPADAAARV